MNFRRLIFGVAFLMLGFILKTYGQAPLTIYAECGSGTQGQQACVTFRVNNFINIEGMQFGITYNSNMLNNSSVDVTNSGLGGLLTSSEISCHDEIGNCGLVWFNGPATIPDGGELFTLCFDIVGDPGNCVPVEISDVGVEIEIISSGNIVPVILIPCCINITTNQLTIISGFCDPTTPVSSDGNLHFYCTGGQAPYTWSISGPVIQNGLSTDGEEINITNLPKGLYTVNVTDANGVIKMKNINLTDNNPITFDIGGRNPTCASKKNGFVGISNVEGGLTPLSGYDVSWSQNLYNIDTITELANGTYFVTVEDANGCRATDSWTLDTDTLRLDAFVADSALCKGSKTGALKIVASGGTQFNDGTYKLKLKSPTDAFMMDLARFDGDTTILVAPGTSLFFISDSATPASCVSDTFKINMPYKKNILFDAIYENIVCNGIGFGKINVSPYNSGTDYSIFLYDESTKMIVNTGSMSNRFNLKNDSLLRGDYYVTAKSLMEGCIDTFHFSILEADTPFLVDTTLTYSICNDQAGVISVVPSGGEMPYSFNWEDIGDGPGQRTDLGQGVYKVTVTDNLGCSKDFSFSIPQVSNLAIDAVVLQSIKCNGFKDGSIIVNSIAQGTIDYHWENAQGVSVGNGQIVSNLGAGAYFVTVTVDGCSAHDSVLLVDPPGMVFTDATITKPDCKNGGFKGSLGVTLSGGFQPYDFKWTSTSDPNLVLSNQSVLAGIDAGSYHVEVADVSGCTRDTTLVLGQGVEININLSNIGDITCFSNNDGRATATPSSSNPLTNSFTYFWSSSPLDGGMGLSNTATHLSPGQNWVLVSDSKCLSDTLFFNINSANEIKVAETLTHPSCDGTCTGSIMINISGGSGAPYQQAWQGGITPNNLCEGNYNLTVTDNSGCTAAYSYTLIMPEAITVMKDSSISVPITCRTNVAQIGVKATGGNGNYIYNWSNNASQTNIASNLPAGTYTVSVSDNNGCLGTYRETIVSVNPVKAIVADPISPKCNGDKTCIRIGAVSGGIPGMYTFQINQGLNVRIDSCVEVYAGTYLINVFDAVGCKFDTTIVIDQPNPVTVDLGPDITLSLGESTPIIKGDISSDLPIINFLWSEFSPLECLTESCEEIQGIPLNDMSVRLLAVDENGCVGNDELKITISDVRNVFFPNVFRPNGGDDNSTFNVYTGFGVEQIEQFKVFDRWGNVLYNKEAFLPETNQPLDGWDGTYNGEKLIPGVYVYYALVRFIDGRVLKYTGDVTLVR